MYWKIIVLVKHWCHLDYPISPRNEIPPCHIDDMHTKFYILIQISQSYSNKIKMTQIRQYFDNQTMYLTFDTCSTCHVGIGTSWSPSLLCFCIQKQKTESTHTCKMQVKTTTYLRWLPNTTGNVLQHQLKTYFCDNQNRKSINISHIVILKAG